MPKQQEDFLITIVVASVFFVLIGIFLMILVFFFLRRQRKNKMEKEDMRNHFEQTLLNTQLEIQDHTFNYISQEIHDNIGQILSLVRINMNVLSEKFGEDQFDTTDELLGKAIKDLRNLSHNLNSNRLNEIGIVEGLRTLIIQLDKTEKYTTEFSSPEHALSFMNNDHSLILYRMVQEVIHNILKHANATHISLDIKAKGNNAYFVSITDNGKGFDMKSLEGQNTGIGLQNIFSRAKLINATVKVNSKEGEGTSIIFEITNQKITK
ncbi:MAG: ATP-binding protein [Bacteroidota bacterium]|jgi:signal transduction histidine kinase